MMTIKSTLQRAGFTQNEVKVYLTLLKIGRTTSYKIVKEAKVSSGKIYETFDKLIARGIVSYIMINGKKHFETAKPERLLDYMKKKELEIHEEVEEVKKIMPELKLKQKLVEKESKAEIFEGISGIKTVYELMLRETKGTALILGAPKEAGERLNYYFDNFNRRRDFNLRIILNYAHPRKKKLETTKKTKVKIFPKNVTTPAWVNIFNDYVATFNLADKPIVFLIKNKRIADSYRQYFELMWKSAK